MIDTLFPSHKTAQENVAGIVAGNILAVSLIFVDAVGVAVVLVLGA